MHADCTGLICTGVDTAHLVDHCEVVNGKAGSHKARVDWTLQTPRKINVLTLLFKYPLFGSLMDVDMD